MGSVLCLYSGKLIGKFWGGIISGLTKYMDNKLGVVRNVWWKLMFDFDCIEKGIYKLLLRKDGESIFHGSMSMV